MLGLKNSQCHLEFQLSRFFKSYGFVLCTILYFATVGVVNAEQHGSRSFLPKTAIGGYEVPIYKSGMIPLDVPAKRVSVGNSEVADILIFQNRQLDVLGKSLGTTNVVVWDKKNKVFDAFDIQVTHDLEVLKYKLYELIPGEAIQVNSVQQNLILSGEASNIVKMNAAMELAKSFIPPCKEDKGGCGTVVNMMQVGGAQQVMLQIKVAEIARSVLKTIGSDTNFVNSGNDGGIGLVGGGASFPDAINAEGLRTPVFGSFAESNGIIGPAIKDFTPTIPSISSTGVALSLLAGDFLIQSFIDASRQKGLARILAEPVLTTMSGQDAEFLSGGEFPIPVAQDLGTISIVFKEFGVGVKFLPVVLDSGRINLKLNISVTELSSDVPVLLDLPGSSGQFSIPSLTKRSVKNTVELANGQTIGIAGLISDNLRESVDKFPGLGDVPMFGTLFRSQEFRSGQTELVIFVTPHLAKPIARNKIRLPTDSFIEPSDSEFYWEGKMEGSAPAKNAPLPDTSVKQSSNGGVVGEFGHEM